MLLQSINTGDKLEWLDVSTRFTAPVSFIDAVTQGLRGVCAMFVFLSHWLGHLTGGDIDSLWTCVRTVYLDYPFIRLTHIGQPQVRMFYVLSAIAISHRPLDFRTTVSYCALASSVFRRFGRLAIPCTIIRTLSSFILITGGYGFSAQAGRWIADTVPRRLSPYSISGEAACVCKYLVSGPAFLQSTRQ